MNVTELVCVWEAGTVLGEGALWHAPTASVYFVDIKGQRILRCAADGSARREWSTPRQVGFVVPARDGLLCGLQGGLHYLDQDSGAFTPLCAVEPEQPGNRINDGFVDAQGRLWFGTMDDAETWPTGALYRLSAGGEPQLADVGYVVSNGPAISPDGRTLYHNDTLSKLTFAFDVAPDGSLQGKRVFADFDGQPGYPDGMAVDAEGCVWIAHYGGWRIDCFSPRGALLNSISFPCANVTKLAFGGSDLRTVFVTTARKGLSAEELERQPLAGALFSFRSEVSGLPGQVFGQGGQA